MTSLSPLSRFRLILTLNGNRIASVIDDAGYVTRAGANDFRQGTDNRMTYNAAGALLSDGNRGIARIDYDRFGRPRRAQFTSGSLTEWVYTAAGDKIRTIHTTVADGVTVPLGGEVEITPAMVLHSDTTEYAGEFVWENGRIKRALYPGGFASYDDAGNCTFNYYTADHVGNVRTVTDEYGTVVQRTDYYPFGSVIADRGFGSGVQPYKTAGKETDLMHGLDVADFGARLYNPTLPQWDRIDPKADKRYHIDPYSYCSDNPVNRIDPNGETDFVNSETMEHKYVKDGQNCVISISDELYSQLTDINFDPTSEIYGLISAKGVIQNDLFYTVENVLKDTSYVPYKGNCYEAAILQNSDPTTGANDRIDLYNNSTKTYLFEEGTDYIINQLTNGKSVVAGVSYGKNVGNHNPDTSHFINIVGMGIEVGANGIKNYFMYYDNATANEITGANTTKNRLYPAVIQRSGIKYYQNRKYILSEVRKNR